MQCLPGSIVPTQKAYKIENKKMGGQLCIQS